MQRYDIIKSIYKIRRLLGKKSYENRTKEAVEKLNIKPNTNILDVACGPGYNFKYIIEYLDKNVKITAIDISDEMILLAEKEATKLQITNIFIEKHDINKYGNKLENNFDYIIVNLGLSVFNEWKDVIKKLKMLLKENGKICVIDSNIPKNIFAPVVRLWFFIVGAENRDLRNELTKNFSEKAYKEYNQGAYFYFIGEK